jgi:hypothetical protein
MVTRADKTVADYRERASRVRALAEVAASLAVRRALLSVAARYDAIADGAAASAGRRRAKRAMR